MAKRTYHDANGYKKKRRKRGTPEFATVDEYKAWINAKRKATLDKNPCMKFSGPRLDLALQPFDLLAYLLVSLQDQQGQQGIEDRSE